MFVSLYIKSYMVLQLYKSPLNDREKEGIA